MNIKAALLKVQNDTVALVMAPAEFVTNHSTGNNIVNVLQRLTFQGKPVVLVSEVPGRGYVYYGRQDLMDYFNRANIQIEDIWSSFKDYTVNIPGM
jgi:hypothetical protein